MPELKLERLQPARLDAIDLTIAGGEVLCLHGPSGAGKTVLLRAVADLDPNDGDVVLNGERRSALPPCLWRRRIGYLPAESAWWQDRVGDHLAEWRCEYLTGLGFDTDVLDWDCGRLSSGERQRLGLARMLSGAPAALLLDEPTANLDDGNTARVEQLVDRYRRDSDCPVVWVSHDPEQRERIGNRSCEIDRGTLRCP